MNFNNWQLTKLDEITEKITKGATPTSYGYQYQESGINFVKIENIDNYKVQKDTISQYISEDAHKFQSRSSLKNEDILYGIAGSIGKLAIVDQTCLPANTNQALAIIRSDRTKIDPEFLLFYLSSNNLASTRNKARGGAMNNISLQDIRDIEIKLPSIPEQKQIVSKIKECFTLLDKSEQKLKQAEEKLSLVINSSNKLFKTKTSNITYKLSEVFKLRNGKFNPSSNLKKNFDTEFKFKVYGGNGVTGYFNKALVQGQTIIIGRVGAKCGSIHKSKEPVWVTDNALYIETFLKEVDLEFLYWKLISLNLNGLSDGTGQPKIDQSKIYNLTIDIPNTMEEQKRIARQFEITNERVNNSLAQIQSNKSAIQNIRQSILKKAFEGKLI